MAADMAPLRTRTYERADTGRYPDWAAISAALLGEGEIEISVRRLDHDQFFMLRGPTERARG